MAKCKALTGSVVKGLIPVQLTAWKDSAFVLFAGKIIPKMTYCVTSGMLNHTNWTLGGVDPSQNEGIVAILEFCNKVNNYRNHTMKPVYSGAI